MPKASETDMSGEGDCYRLRQFEKVSWIPKDLNRSSRIDWDLDQVSGTGSLAGTTERQKVFKAANHSALLSQC